MYCLVGGLSSLYVQPSAECHMSELLFQAFIRRAIKGSHISIITDDNCRQ